MLSWSSIPSFWTCRCSEILTLKPYLWEKSQKFVFRTWSEVIQDLVGGTLMPYLFTLWTCSILSDNPPFLTLSIRFPPVYIEVLHVVCYGWVSLDETINIESWSTSIVWLKDHILSELIGQVMLRNMLQTIEFAIPTVHCIHPSYNADLLLDLESCWSHINYYMHFWEKVTLLQYGQLFKANVSEVARNVCSQLKW